MLHFLAYPRVGGDVIQIGRQPGPRDDTPEPGASTRRWRAKERWFIKELRRLANQLDAEIHGDPIEREKGWRCPSCGRWQRPQSRACDRCVDPQVLRTDEGRTK